MCKNPHIGLNPNVGSGFDGAIDEVAVFNAVLTGADIESIMNDGFALNFMLTHGDAVDSAGKLTTTWGDLKTSR